MYSSNHDHHHGPNGFAVIPTHVRLNADPNYTDKGVTLAFIDSGFYPHPDLLLPKKRIVAYKDLSDARPSLDLKLWFAEIETPAAGRYQYKLLLMSAAGSRIPATG